MPYDDPIVEEVRKTRQIIFEKFDYDLRKYMDYLREEEQKHPERLANIPSIKVKIPGKTGG
ncbi:MAG TPA: hypothetical protein VMW83_01455 [Spirochaetia bacterium]|nr:hypothetical protein [Spirochaetia bacterium]